MNHIAPPPDQYRDKPQTLMESIMNPLSKIRSSLPWIGAIALGLSLASAPALAKKQNSQWQQKQQQKGPQNGPGNLLPGGNGPDHQIISIKFVKYVGQTSCKYIKSKTILAVKGSPGFWNNPNAAHVKEFTDTKLIFEDTLPNGLKWISGDVSGDLDVKPPVQFTNDVFPNDTLRVVKAQLSATENLADGVSSDNTRFFVVNGVAEIDPAAFPNPTSVETQARLTIITPSNIENARSNDGAVPQPADWKDGTPSKLSIDLSECDKPDDGGDPGGDPHGEPCIKIEKGEVECEGGPVPSFTYKMPVGPELAGQTIELTSLTPGVIVNPAFQIVPPGGGVLEWDLIGATKGMTVHLLTNNVKQVGPADFDGLAVCCTEEIIIDIPEDLPCDDHEGEPDLEVTKQALVPECDKAIGGCKFSIKVKNVGTKKFTGKIALREWQIPHRALIDNGPNAGWSCSYDLGLGLYFCKTAPVILNPGQSRTLNLSFKPGNAWPSDKIKNCAKLDYEKMGVAPFGDLTNDKDCAEICIKGSNDCPDDLVEKKPDLELRKFLSSVNCLKARFANPVCTVKYAIIIHNFGDAAYFGPLHVEDNFDSKPNNVVFSPVPPWACATVDGQSFACTHPGIAIPPNGQTILTVEATVSGINQLENCAKLVEGADGKDKDCAIGQLPDPTTDPANPGKPDLSIQKSCKPGVLGGLISCRIAIRNNGTQAPTGIIRIFDVARVIGSNAPLTSQDVNTDGQEWSCEGEPVPDFVCAIAGQHLTPGTTRYFDAKIKISQTGGERYRNCATAHHEPAGADDMNLIGKSCVEGGVDITIEKTGPAICEKGEPCTFDVTIKNEGETDFQGPVQIADALGLAGGGLTVPITSISPPLPCGTQPVAVPFICTGILNLSAGESTTHQITLVFDEDTNIDDGARLRNCAAVLDGNISTVKSSGGQAAAQNSDQAACHNFELGEPVQDQCRPPMVLSAGGTCVCPSGTRWNGRRCIGSTTVPPIVVPDPICIPGKGEIRTHNNRCVCKKGYIRKGPKLCVPPSRGCTPGPNEYKTRKGACVCKAGYTRNSSGYCAKPTPICKLGKNEMRNKVGQCVCKLGFTRNKYGTCSKVKLCKPGRNEMRNSIGNCVCKPGYQRGKGKYCVKQPKLCKPGTNEYRNQKGQCVCKKGYTRSASGSCYKKLDPKPVCTNGKLNKQSVGWYCSCPKGWKRHALKNGGARCSKPIATPKPVCKGGKLTKHGKKWYCACPKGTKRQALKNGGARCTKKVVVTKKPVCSGGKLSKTSKGWYCGCPKGTKRKALKNGGARCVKKVVVKKPVCSGGKLSKTGKGWYCGCPKGTKRKALKNGGARCIKKVVVAKKPPCYSGYLKKRGKGWYCACPKKYKRSAIGNKGGAKCTKAFIYKPKKPTKIYKPKKQIQLKKQPTIKFKQPTVKKKIFIKKGPNKQFF